MAKVTNAYDTYSSANKREDLTNAIYNISPEETPVLSMIGRTSAKAVKHEWQTDALDTASATGEVEGAAFSGSASTATTRLSNTCMIKSRNAVVTGTQEAVNKAGVSSELAYQMAKQTKALKLDIDTIICGKQNETTGDASTARVARGIESWVATNISSGTGGSTSSGTVTDGTQRAITETILKGVLQTCFTNGANPKKLVVGAFNKQAISGFTGRATTTVPTDSNVVTAAVDVYIGDFHRLEVVPSRNSRSRSALLIDPEYLKVAYLREFVTKDYNELGDAKAKQIIAEFTLECSNEKAHGKIADLTTS